MEIEGRLDRQRQVAGKPGATKRQHVAPETILHRQAGSSTIMHEQLTALLNTFDDVDVELHLIPYSAGLYEGVDLTTVTVFDFEAGEDSSVVAIERIGRIEFMDRERTVETYQGILNRLSKYWLDTDQTRQFIERERKNWRSE